MHEVDMNISLIDTFEGKLTINSPLFTCSLDWDDLEFYSYAFDKVFSVLTGNKIVIYSNGANSIIVVNVTKNEEVIINNLEELNSLKSVGSYIAKVYKCLYVSKLEEVSDGLVVLSV